MVNSKLNGSGSPRGRFWDVTFSFYLLIVLTFAIYYGLGYFPYQ